MTSSLVTHFSCVSVCRLALQVYIAHDVCPLYLRLFSCEKLRLTITQQQVTARGRVVTFPRFLCALGDRPTGLEDLIVVVINLVAVKDIGDEF